MSKKTSSRLIIICPIVVILATSPFIIRYLRDVTSRSLHGWYARLLDFGKIPPAIPTEIIRSTFRETTLQKISTSAQNKKTHTHPESASWRSSCAPFGRNLCSQLGLEQFIYQASAADVRNGYKYCRDYHWAKDLMVPYQPIKFGGPRQLTTIVDVDYYVDINSLLIQFDGPILLYTFQPTEASYSSEFSYTFDNDNSVKYSVSGGAQYKHKVWNYGTDIVSVTSGWTSKSYVVERRSANDHHQFVLLVPIGKWRGLYSWLYNWLGPEPIKHLEVVNNGFAVLDVQTKTGMKRSISRTNEYNCVTLNSKTFDAIRSVVDTTSTNVGNATMVSWIEDRHSASVLTDYFRTNSAIKTATVYPPEQGSFIYQITNPQNYQFEPGALLQPFMSPIVPGAFIPDKSVNNEIAAVKGRIVEPQKDIPPQAPTKFLLDCLEEFVKLLIPKPHQHAPYDVDVVYAHQARPAQRSLLERAESDLPNRKCSTFLKAEPYNKASDPRLITTYNTPDKREYSRYTYCFTDEISKNDWYSFGKTPLQIAIAVCGVCTDETGVSCTDAVRMDGHISEVLRNFERMMLLRFFKPEYHVKIIELHTAQFKIKAHTKQNVKYKIEFARGSGSAETAVFNTCVSKLMDFISRRLAHIPAKQAYEAVGQFGGDDTIATSIQPGIIGGSYIKQAGLLVGQVLDVDEFRRGSPGVNYLSRFYTTEVWYGAPKSTCDLKRILSKLHVTPHLGCFTPVEKLQQKLIGLSRTDGETPVVKQILHAAKRVGIDLSIEADRRIGSWASQFDKEVNWPNGYIEDNHVWLAKFFTDCDPTHLYEYLLDCKNPEDLLTMPIIVTSDSLVVPVKTTTVINEEFHHPPPQPKVETTEKLICFAYTKGKCDKGAKCKFLHEKVCRDFIAGQCNRKNCKFSHSKTTTQ
jgi:hypothetical protein